MLHYVTLNSQGLASPIKQLELSVFMSHLLGDIYFLQETNLDSAPTSSQLMSFDFLINPHTQHCSGTAIALRHSLKFDILHHIILVPGYLQCVRITIDGMHYTLINIYMSHDDDVAMQIVQQLDQYLTNSSTDAVILGGDFNVTLHPTDRIACTERRTELAIALSSVVAEHHLIDVERTIHSNSVAMTHVGTQAHRPRSRLDQIYVRSHHRRCILSTSTTPSYSDHCSVSLQWKLTQAPRGSAYWCLNNSLLHDPEYEYIINGLISDYAASEPQAPLIFTWWDELKADIKATTINYSTAKKRDATRRLMLIEANVLSLLGRHFLSAADKTTLRSLQLDLKAHYRQTAQGIQVRTKMMFDFAATTPSASLLRMERERHSSTALTQLRDEGRIITDHRSVCDKARRHFHNIFADSSAVDPQLFGDLFHGLPRLSEPSQMDLELPITFQELTRAVHQLNKGKTPGADGLSAEFFQFFWPQIGPLLHKVITLATTTGTLPTSMQKAVITLLPKRGDLLNIKNWRPISLLTADYKIYGRVLSNRLRSVIRDIVQADQTYCVPGRNIYDNLHLLRDVIHHANANHLPLAVVSLDQAGAFDAVRHKYLLHTMTAFGFGPVFISYIQTAYRNARCLVRVGPTLTAPIPFQRGIRQGDPMSGFLFSISIEPLLNLCRRALTTNALPLTFPWLTTPSPPVVLSSYADDLNFFLTADQGFQVLSACFTRYACVSGASLNRTKSTGLWVGSWKGRLDTPLDFEWTSEGGKFLGVYLGNDAAFEEKNWTGAVEAISVTLQRYRRWLPLTSYLNRRIVLNQVINASLIHVITVLHPPTWFVSSVNSISVKFMWSGLPWLHSHYLYAPTTLGGHNVTYFPAMLWKVRLRFMQRLLSVTHRTSSWFLQLDNLSRYDRIYHPCVTLMCDISSVNMDGMQPFYRSALTAWKDLDLCPALLPPTYAAVGLLPIRNNVYLTLTGNGDLFMPEWHSIGVRKLGDLLSPEGQWKTVEDFRPSATMSTSLFRRLVNNLAKVRNAIPLIFSGLTVGSNSLPAVFKFKSLPNDTPKVFNSSSPKLLYEECLSRLLVRPSITGESPVVQGKVNWDNLYRKPTITRDADISWRFLHDRLITPVRLKTWRKRQSAECPFCGIHGTATHCILECYTVTALWNIIKRILLNLLDVPNLPPDVLLCGIPRTGRTGPEDVANFLVTFAKASIYRLLYAHLRYDTVAPQYTAEFKKQLRLHLSMEFARHAGRQTIQQFEETWCHRSALCYINNNSLNLSEDLQVELIM